MGRVAALSGVNPATLYRRWGTIDALVLDVMVDDLADSSPLTATGDLRADLLQYARQVQDLVSQPNGLHFLRALTAVTDTPDGETAARAIAQRRLDELAALLRSDDARCLAPLDVVNTIVAPITYRRLVAPHLHLEHHELERLVDALLAGAAARERLRSEASQDPAH